MVITVSDIHGAEDFAKRLEAACELMLDGTPRSQALDRKSVSLSVFLNLIKSLKKAGMEENPADVSHPAWQDQLVYDMSGEEYYYLPDDFEEELDEVCIRSLDEEESQVIHLLYPQRKTIEQTAEKLGVSENTVRARRRSALRKLKEHSRELFAGKKYLDKLEDIRTQRDAHQQELDWMTDALYFLEDIDEDEKTPVDELPVSQEALAFYRRNGLTTIADVINYSPSELFTEITKAAGGLATVRESDDFSLDSPLDESIGLDTKTANAFKLAGISTVREYLALDEATLLSIKGVGPKTIIWLYRRVLFG